MLLADAFTNYRQIMGDVTLSPAMGQYLDMANNAMANPAAGTLANENYARELMQLFTIGTHMLNQDGSVQVDGNNLPIPTYSQSTITEFARVFTGWTYAPPPGSPWSGNAYITGNGPMVPYPPEHDSGSKQLLNGYVSPAGITPLQDLNNALDNIFNHPNVGPFVGKHADPAPGEEQSQPGLYLARGGGIQQQRPGRARRHAGRDHGHPARSRSPRQRQRRQRSAHRRPFAGARAVHRRHGPRLRRPDDRPELLPLGSGQHGPGSSSTRPAYSTTTRPTTSFRAPRCSGGEFQIHTPNTAIWRANVVRSLFSQWSNPVQNYGPGTTVDLTPFLPLASTPATLVNALDLTLTHGTMPAAMKTDHRDRRHRRYVGSVAPGGRRLLSDSDFELLQRLALTVSRDEEEISEMLIRSRREFLQDTLRSVTALGAVGGMAKFGEMNALAAGSELSGAGVHLPAAAATTATTP